MADSCKRICIVGAGTHFISGISYYTLHLSRALSESSPVSVIFMRRLLPKALYPGRARVGAPITSMTLPLAVPYVDGVDWYWIPSIFRALRFLVRQRPTVVILQWWTGTVFHTYALLALVTRLLGGRIVIEFHEVQDTGEVRLRMAGAYAGMLGRFLVRLADGFVIHSEYDRDPLETRYRLGTRPVALIPHGPYSQYSEQGDMRSPIRASDSVCNLLFFGTIRPYKGVEDLIRAFDLLSAEEVKRFRLTVVGETWEGWTLPNELIARSPYRDRITFVNRYVTDDEAARFFAAADAVVLPYLRSSASGPLHVTMNRGLPVVVTDVGGLKEAAQNYEGALFIPPHDPDVLKDALVAVWNLRHIRFEDPHSWDRTVAEYERLFDSLDDGAPITASEPCNLVSAGSRQEGNR